MTILSVTLGFMWLSLALYTLILKVALQKTVEMKRRHALRARRLRRSPLRKGTPVPTFSAPIYGSQHTIQSSAFKGHPTILMFVTPDDMRSSRYLNLTHGLHALWHKSRGNLYLLCRGSEELCLDLAQRNRIRGLQEHDIKLLLDKDGHIGQLFRILSTPHAVEIDRHGRIARYGRPEPPTDISEEDGIKLAAANHLA